MKKRNRDSVNNKIIGLREAANSAQKIIGTDEIELLDFPDNRLDSIDRLDLIKEIEERIELHSPDTVYVHHIDDLNIDHRRIHEAVVTACRPTPGFSVRRILSYEVASSTEWQSPTSGKGFQPNWFVDITNQWQAKRKALEAYSQEMKQWPHARSITAIEHMARWRGAQVGVEAAEAFCLIRNLE